MLNGVFKPMANSHKAVQTSNKKIAAGICVFVAGMTAFSIFAVPPAYRLFCQVTGWGGTTQRAEIAPANVLERKINVRFDASIDPDLPWTFKPEQIDQTMPIGESMLAFYLSENHSENSVTGHASFNVSPAKAGQYFRKIDCFCFTEQTLKAGEKVSMPVAYFIDPAIDNDRNMDEVETITLSYTFFRTDDPKPSTTAALATQ